MYSNMKPVYGEFEIKKELLDNGKWHHIGRGIKTVLDYLYEQEVLLLKPIKVESGIIFRERDVDGETKNMEFVNVEMEFKDEQTNR